MPMPVSQAKMSLHALEFAERRARYAFLSTLIEGASVVEVLDPEALLEPGAAFLTSLGAASAQSLLARPSASYPLPCLTAAFGGPTSGKEAQRPLLILDDGLSWLSAQDHFEALLRALDAAVAEARIALVLRNPAGTALASLDGHAVRERAVRFDFPGISRALQARFPSVAFATQSAVWGSQLAPLTDDAQALDCAIDGRLSEPASAAFFIALCARSPIDLPCEWTLVPLDLRPLTRCANRFDKLADDLQRAQAQRAHAEVLLGRQREDRCQRDELECRLAQAVQARGEFEVRCQKAEARCERTERLLDELAAERAVLTAQLEDASKKIAALNAGRIEDERCRHEAEAARAQAQREREAHLRLSKAAMDQLHARIQALEAALAAVPGERAAKPLAPTPIPGAPASHEPAREPDAERMRREIEAQAARIQALDRLILEQDVRLEELEALEQRLELSRAEKVQREARIAEVEAKLIERSLLIDALAEELRAMDQAVDLLARKRNGQAIEALLELHAQLRADRPQFAIDDACADGHRQGAAAKGEGGNEAEDGEGEDDGEEALI